MSAENKKSSSWRDALKKVVGGVLFHDVKEVDVEQWCDDVDHLKSKEKQHDQFIKGLMVRRVNLKRQAAELELVLELENQKENLKKESGSYVEWILKRASLSLKGASCVARPSFKELDDDELLLWKDASLEKFIGGTLRCLLWLFALFSWMGVSTNIEEVKWISSIVITGSLSVFVYCISGGGPLRHLKDVLQAFAYDKEVEVRQQRKLLKETLHHSLEHRLIGNLKLNARDSSERNLHEPDDPKETK